jgi:Replication-relaxation
MSDLVARNGSPFPRPLPPSKQASQARQQAAMAAVGDATQPRPRPAAPVRRLSRRQLVEVAERLPARERAVLKEVERLRLMRVDQLQRLLYSEIASPMGRARICRRSLRSLADLGLLRRLERRVGGTSSGGSSGYVYALAPAGRRLLAYWSGAGIVSDRGVHEPQPGFVEHTLATAELYVTLTEAERAGTAELLVFDPEPDCWRSYTARTGRSALLKPDALVRLGVGVDELSWFCELDRATQGRGALLRKLDAYLAYYQSGREQAETGVFPRVAWITTSPPREQLLCELCERLGDRGRRLFAVTTQTDAVALLAGTQPARGPA